jgi:protein SERAC1
MPGSAKSKVFRVTGLPVGEAEPDVQSTLAKTIHDLLSDDEKLRLEVRIACIPSCDQNKTSSALVEFRDCTPKFLSLLEHNLLGDWQVEMGNTDINFDCHFFGFTQLYATNPGLPVTAEYHLPPLLWDSKANARWCSIVAITGLDGHAYGSWRGKGNLGRMWLRDFLSKDLPQCRTMIYGYNSKLLSRGVHTIMDYGREFLERIKRVRYTKEVSYSVSSFY